MNLSELFKKKEFVYLLGGVVFVVLCGLALWAYSRDDEEETYHTVSLETTEYEEHSWENVEFEEDFAEPDELSLPVYKLSDLDIDVVQDFVDDLGFTASSETVAADGRYYSWGGGQDTVLYDSVTRNLMVNSTGIQLSKLGDTYVTLDSAVDHFNEFIENYLDLGMASSISAERRGDVYEVHGNWKVDGYAINGSFNQEYTIIVQFNEDGELIALIMDLISLSSSDETVELISLENVSSYVQLGTYPKEAFIDVSVASEPTCMEEGCFDDEYSIEEGFSDANISEVEIVYYYAPTKTEEVLPVYKLEGTATIIDESGEPITVGITIYANAIDPSRILIPTEE